MAPGPWISVPGNPDYVKELQLVGTLIEARGIDDEGKAQGSFIAEVIDCLSATGAGRSVVKPVRIKLQVLGSSDKEYWTWVKATGNPLWYFLSGRVKAKPFDMKSGKQLAFPICEFRVVTYVKGEELGVDWLSKRHTCYKHIEQAFANTRAGETSGAARSTARLAKSKTRGTDRVEPPAGSRPQLHDLDNDLDGESLSGSTDKEGGDDVETDLKKLRSELTKGDGVVKNKGKDKKVDTHGCNSKTDATHGQGDQNRARSRDRDRQKRRGSPGKKSRSRSRSTCVKRGREKVTVILKERPFGSSGKARLTPRASHKDKKSKKEKMKRKRSASPSGHSAGSGSDADGTSSDASQVFRDASSSTNKPSRNKLVQFAERHPGRLAERFLNRMYRKVMVEGEATHDSAKGLPVVAKAYHLRVTAQIHPETNRRHLGETSVIAHVLDHLAARRFDQAADILAQRYTSLEALMAGLPYDRARFLELTCEDDNTLVGQHERALMANEASHAARIGDWPQSYQPWFPKGKGQEAWSGKNGWKGKGGWKANPFADQLADGPRVEHPVGRAPAEKEAQEAKGGKNQTKGKWKKKGQW